MSEKRERKNGGLTNEELAELAKKAGKRVMEYHDKIVAQEKKDKQKP